MLRSCNNKPWFARCVNRRYNKRKLVPEHKLQPHPRSQRSNVELPPPPRCFLEKKLLPRTTRRKIVPLSFGCSFIGRYAPTNLLFPFISNNFANNALVKNCRDKPNRIYIYITKSIKREMKSKRKKEIASSFSQIFF